MISNGHENKIARSEGTEKAGVRAERENRMLGNYFLFFNILLSFYDNFLYICNNNLTKMENKSEKGLRGINAFSFLYFAGLILVVEQLVYYSQWTIRLIKNWELPNEAFFSKINLLPLDSDLSLTWYLVFAIAYIVFYTFILIGLIQLNRALKLLSEKIIFLPEISSDFKKAGKSLMIFVIGTFIVDFALLLTASTSRPILDLFATETVVFVILSYLLFFLSDILKEGIVLKEENELTI